jgi:hypothetical protein
VKICLQRLIQTGYPFWGSSRPRPRNGSVSSALETQWPTLGNTEGMKTASERAEAAAAGVGGDSGERQTRRQRDPKVCAATPHVSSFASSLNQPSSSCCFPQAFSLTQSLLRSTPPPATPRPRSPAVPQPRAGPFPPCVAANDIGPMLGCHGESVLEISGQRLPCTEV